MTRRIKDSRANEGTRARMVRDVLVGEGHREVEAMPYRQVLEPGLVYEIHGARNLKGNMTIGQALDVLAADHPNRAPAIIRTIDPELERAVVSMRFDDFARLTAGRNGHGTPDDHR